MSGTILFKTYSMPSIASALFALIFLYPHNTPKR